MKLRGQWAPVATAACFMRPNQHAVEFRTELRSTELPLFNCGLSVVIGKAFCKVSLQVLIGESIVKLVLKFCTELKKPLLFVF